MIVAETFKLSRV